MMRRARKSLVDLRLYDVRVSADNNSPILILGVSHIFSRGARYVNNYLAVSYAHTLIGLDAIIEIDVRGITRPVLEIIEIFKNRRVHVNARPVQCVFKLLGVRRSALGGEFNSATGAIPPLRVLLRAGWMLEDPSHGD